MSLAGRQSALLKAALEARGQAYAPYSRLKVGAALRLVDGRTFSGVNVENASFGLTVCAERHAIAAAVAAGARPGDVREIAVVANTEVPIAPCGACRQVLREFSRPDATVWMHSTRSGETKHAILGELLPQAFDGSDLSR